MGPLIAILVVAALAAAGWRFLVVPAQRRQRSHLAMQDGVEVGDEIITAGGLHALVREAGERELQVEIAAGVVVRLDRRAVAAVAVDEVADGAPAPGGDDPREVRS